MEIQHSSRDIDGLRAKLSMLIDEQKRCMISNGRYFTDQKRSDDAEIYAVQQKIKALEAA